MLAWLLQFSRHPFAAYNVQSQQRQMVENCKPDTNSYYYLRILFIDSIYFHIVRLILYEQEYVSCTLQWVEVECSKLYAIDQTIQNINAKKGKETVNHATLAKFKVNRAFNMSSSTNGIYSDPTLDLFIMLYSGL